MLGVSKEKARGLEVRRKKQCQCPTMWAVSSFKSRNLRRREHLSCVKIDRRKPKMRGQDGSSKSGGGKESPDTQLR